MCRRLPIGIPGDESASAEDDNSNRVFRSLGAAPGAEKFTVGFGVVTVFVTFGVTVGVVVTLGAIEIIVAAVVVCGALFPDAVLMMTFCPTCLIPWECVDR